MRETEREKKNQMCSNVSMAANYLPSHQHVEAGRNYISQEVWSPGSRQVSELKQDEGRKKNCLLVFHQASFLMKISNAFKNIA